MAQQDFRRVNDQQPSKAGRRAQQDLSGEDGPQVRVGGRRSGERRTGRLARQTHPESAVGAESRDPVPTKPCAVLTGIARQQLQGRRNAENRVRRGLLDTPLKGVYKWTDAA